MKVRPFAWFALLSVAWILGACSSLQNPDQRATRAYNNFVGDVDVLIGKLEGSETQIEFNNHIISNANDLLTAAENFNSTLTSLDTVSVTDYEDLSAIATQGTSAGKTWQSLADQLSVCELRDWACQQIAFDSNLDFAPRLDKLLKDMTRYSTLGNDSRTENS